MSQSSNPAPRSARERILATASELFYREGYRAVGIDRIIEEAGVAKASLYRSFPSKDDLIVAYLERADAEFQEWFDRAVAGQASAREKLIALFEATGRLARSPSCLGCTFQAAAAEFPEPGHPGHGVAVAHKRRVLGRIRQLAAEAGATDPDALAEQLLLLMDGAFAAARVFGRRNHSRGIGAAARELIDAATGGRSG